MPVARFLKLIAARIAFRTAAGNDALLRLDGACALLPAGICLHSAILLTGVGSAELGPRRAG